jgi:putative ABC transport system permease protein
MGWVFDEIRSAWRALMATPGFSLLVVAVLAAGLCCVLYIFAVINGLILRPLPFPEAERLYYIGVAQPDELDDVESVDAEHFVDYRRRYSEVADVAGLYEATVNLSDGKQPERFDGAFATANLFPMLGQAPALGRTFSAEEDRPGAPLTIVLSDSLWRSRYGADPRIIGRTIRANAQPATVIGVMPPRFSFPTRQAAWLPARLDETNLKGPQAATFEVLARLKTGHSPTELQSLHEAWLAERRAEKPAAWQGLVTQMQPAKDRIVDKQTRGLMGVMFAAVMLVLLIGCANAANLFLVRVMSRRQELAVRAALGASRARLTVNVFAQALTLALVAVAVSLPIAQYFVHATMQSFAESDSGPATWMRFEIDGWSVAFAVAVALLTALAVGVLPAWRSGADMNAAIRDGSRGNTGGSFGRVSRGLVIGEIALSCVLLISAGVLIRIVRDMNVYDFGVTAPEQLLTARIALFPEAYPTPDRQLEVYRQLRERVRGDAVVIDAGMGDALPGLSSADTSIQPDGYEPGEQGYPSAQIGSVDERFTNVYGIDLAEGRALAESDTATSEPVALVDLEFAQTYFAGTSALGRRVRLDPSNPDGRTVTIVGVTRNLHLEDVDDPAEPTMLVPLSQSTQRFVTIAIRVRGEPASYAPRLAEHMRAVDADTPLYWVRTYDRIIELATFGERVLVKIFGAFGLIALLLAAAGLYGVIAYNVGARTREIGVRRALGAPDAMVVRTVLTRSAWQVSIGLTLGLVLGVPFAAVLGQLLSRPGIDPIAVTATVLVLVVAAVGAAVLPTLRALRVDPMIALRYE